MGSLHVRSSKLVMSWDGPLGEVDHGPLGEVARSEHHMMFRLDPSL